MHGTTHEQVLKRWEEDRAHLQPINGRLAYPYRDDEQRKVARDAYVSWQGSRYSVLLPGHAWNAPVNSWQHHDLPAGHEYIRGSRG